MKIFERGNRRQNGSRRRRHPMNIGISVGGIILIIVLVILLT